MRQTPEKSPDPPSEERGANVSSESPSVSALPARRAACAILTGVVFIVLIGLFIRRTELVAGQYVSAGVPPLPAFSALLLLTLIAPLLRRFAPRLAPTRAQMLLIYMMLTVAIVLNGLYH